MMIKYYLKTAWKILLKDKAIASINIIGLGLGMSICLLIITILKDQLSFDNFHRNGDHIYRINTEVFQKSGQKERYATAPYPLAGAVKDRFPFIKNAVSLTMGLSGKAVAAGKSIGINGYFTNPAFFDVFTVYWLFGNENSALREPNSIVLSQETSEIFFGNQNPLGQVMRIANLGDFTVTGVIKHFPGKTHITFDALAANSFIKILEKEKKLNVSDNWSIFFSTYVYVQVNDKRYSKTLSVGLNEFGGGNNNTSYRRLQFYLQPFGNIVPGPLLSNNLGRALPIHLIWILGILAAAVIFSAGFNFNSLFIAQSLTRSKEIGIRKVAGASRLNLVVHFVVQGIITSLLSLVVGFFLYQLFLIPLFEGLSFIREFDVSFRQDVFLIIIYVIFGLLAGLVSALIPAIYLSALDPVKSLKNDQDMLPGLGFKKMIFIVQFTLALVFTIIIINIYRQISLVTRADYGLQTKNIVNINLPDTSYATMRHAFSICKGVQGVSGISHLMGTEHFRNVPVQLKEDDEKINVQDFSIDDHYINNLQLKLLAGKNFDANLPVAREIAVIVNERFLNRFRLGSPVEAIGKTIIVADSLYLSIGAVVKDFHFKSFRYEIEPLLLRYRPNDITRINIRIEDGNEQATIAALEKVWHSVEKLQPFAYSFFDDDLAFNYKNFRDIGIVFGLVALLSICVSALGLLGLVKFILKKREKEIGIRKVLGANIFQITFLLSRSFSRQLLLACFIGIPLSILFMYSFLNQFSYRINPVAGYLTGIIILFVITFSIAGGRIIRSAKTNPVEALKK